MIVVRPHPFGTIAFRPVTAGFAPRPTVADGFRPVVAGQYLRTSFDVSPAELSLLGSPSQQSAYSVTVNLSPQFIWKMMSAVAGQAPSTRDGSHAIPGPVPQSDSRPVQPPPAPQTDDVFVSASVSAADGTSAFRSTGSDRFQRLEEVVRWLMPVSSQTQLPPLDRREDGIFSPLPLRLRDDPRVSVDQADSIVTEILRGIIRRSSIPSTDSAVSVSDYLRHHPAYPRPSGLLPNEFAPLSRFFPGDGSASNRSAGAWAPSLVGLHDRDVVHPDHLLVANRHGEQRQRMLSGDSFLNVDFLVSPLARRVAEGLASESVPGSRDVGAEPRELRTLITSRFGFGGIAAVGVNRPSDLLPLVCQVVTNDAAGELRSIEGDSFLNVDFLISPLARRVAEGFASDKAPRSRDVGAAPRELRTLIIPRFGFGGIAAVGVHRPADLLPVVCQLVTNDAAGEPRSIENAGSLLGGAEMAGTFASSLSARHGRSVDAFTEPGVLPVVVRSASSAAAPSYPAQVSSQSWTTHAPAVNPSRPFSDLPPDLVQRLTEQIVRSLDARTLAARERMGRF